jgi:hypothetical protein
MPKHAAWLACLLLHGRVADDPETLDNRSPRRLVSCSSGGAERGRR